MSASPHLTSALEQFLAGAPPPQRAGLKLLLQIGARPRGKALLASAPVLHQVASSLLEMARYDDPSVSKSLGFDAEEVVKRGRELRAAEGRP